jgi:hypothetical protein
MFYFTLLTAQTLHLKLHKELLLKGRDKYS